MNTKKKILSFALACLMIVMTFSAAIPAFAEETVVCKIGDTGYGDFASAFEAAKDGDTINILQNITFPAAATFEGKAITIALTDKGFIATSGTVKFVGISFSKTDTATNSSPIAQVKGGNFTFSTCTFTIDAANTGTNSSQSNSYFLAGSNGGTFNMVSCKINITKENAQNTLVFSSYADNQKANINLNNTTITTNSEIDIARLCAKMTVNIIGDTQIATGGGDLFIEALNATTSRHGGTVNIYNGKTYGSYTVPELMDGASIRISKQGLRFTIADVSNLGATYGMLFAKNSIDEEENSTWGNINFVLGAEKTVSASADGTGLNGTSYNMVLTGATLDQDYAARAYAQYTDCGGATITVYSAFDASKNVRSMKGIAQYIIDNDASSYETADIDSIESVYGIQ